MWVAEFMKLEAAESQGIISLTQPYSEARRRRLCASCMIERIKRGRGKGGGEQEAVQ